MKGVACAFQGRLGRDPYVGTTKKGKPWCRFSVAVDGRDQDEETQWVSVSCFGRDAGGLGERLTKGSEVYVEGTMSINEWTNKAGEKVAGLSAIGWDVTEMGKPGRGPTGGSGDDDVPPPSDADMVF